MGVQIQSVWVKIRPIILIAFLFVSEGFASGAIFRDYEILDSHEGLTILLHFDRQVNFIKTFDRIKNRYRLEIPGAKSRKYSGRQDLDHLLAISFFVKNLSRGLQIILYQRGEIEVQFESLLKKRSIKIFLPNPYPTRNVLDPGGKKYVICIDPGHGGNDPGAEGIQLEKEMNVLVAKTLRDIINRSSGMRAFLTRETDYKIKLEDRPKISDRAGADVFISLHMNASTPPTRGFEIFYLSEEGAEENIDKNIEGFKSHSEVPADQDPLSLIKPDLVHKILLDIKQGENMNSSSLLAHALANEMRKFPGSKFRGVRRQAFAVLKTLNTPSVLIELGFITNKRDAKLYLTSSTRNQMANLIVNGIRNFFIEQNLVPLPLREIAETKSVPVSKPEEILQRKTPTTPFRPLEARASLAKSKDRNPVEVEYYRVRPGDTFIKIAQYYKIPYQALMDANPETKPSKIPIGKKLRIPRRENQSRNE